MTSEEAVGKVARLLMAHKDDPDADIAALFIEEVLKCATERIKNTYEEEEQLTLEELKSRPCGKKDYSHRSCLHDDITVIIIQLEGSAGDECVTMI
eukprot:SAG31_NODE_5094_length_2747_cov_1.641616_6_plen_96_part_01